MDEPPKGFERRMVHRLLRHWRDAQPEEGGTPSLAAVLAQPIEEDIPPAMAVLALPPGGGEPTFERIGEALAADVDSDLLGRAVSAAPADTLLAHGLGYYRRVVDRGVPVTLGDSFTDAEGRTVLYRSIILPLSEGGGGMTGLMAAANCKVVGNDG